MKHFNSISKQALVLVVFFGILSACSAPEAGSEPNGDGGVELTDSTELSEENAVPVKKPGEKIESLSDYFVITITAPPGDQMIVDGQAVDFVELRKLLQKNGVMNVAYRDFERPNLSTRRLLIRCDPAQTFDYIKAILQICAAPDVAIHKIELASLDGDGGQSKFTNADLPIDFVPEELNEEIVEEMADDDSVAKAKSDKRMAERFTSVKLIQVKGTKKGERLVKQETAIFLNGVEVSGTRFGDKIKSVRMQLVAIHKVSPDLQGRIESDRGVPHGRVVSVLDLFHEAQFEKITFVGLRPNTNIKKANKLWRQMKDAMNTDK